MTSDSPATHQPPREVASSASAFDGDPGVQVDGERHSQGARSDSGARRSPAFPTPRSTRPGGWSLSLVRNRKRPTTRAAQLRSYVSTYVVRGQPASVPRLLGHREARSSRTRDVGPSRAPPILAGPGVEVVSRIEVERVARRIGGGAVRRARTVISRVALVDLDQDVVRVAAALDPPELRTLDAIHLATAILLGRDLGAFCAYDRSSRQRCRLEDHRRARPCLSAGRGAGLRSIKDRRSS